MEKREEIKVTPQMIEAAHAATSPYFDVYDSWLVPVLVEKVAAAFCAAAARERSGACLGLASYTAAARGRPISAGSRLI
jgi:hypothetical protein